MRSVRSLMAVALIFMMMVVTACGTSKGNSDANKGTVSPPASSAASKESQEPAKETPKVSELVVYGVAVDEEKLSKYWKPFEDEHQLKIKVVTTTADKFMASFMAAHNAKQTIDVMMLNGQHVRYMATSGMIQDLTSSAGAYKDRFIQTALDPYTVDGKIFSIPSGSMATTAIFYNKKIFADNGLQPPKNLQELADVSAALKKKGISAISMMGQTIFRWPMWYFQTFAQTSGNKSVERTFETLQGKAKFTDPDYVAAMDAIKQFTTSGAFIPGVNGVEITAARAIFSTGKAAMYYGGNWEAEILRTIQDSDSKLDIAVAKFPMVTDQSGIIAQSTGGSGVAMSIYSGIDPAKQDLALKFLDYWTSDALQQQMLDDANGVLAVNKNVKSKSEDPVFIDLTENYLKDTVTFLDWYWPPEITTAFQENIQAVVGGQKQPQAAMEDIQKVFDGLVANGYAFDKNE